ncbi:MAG: enoyl-CoA hydratase/isomerase family protein [Chloroflexi bacterium]|nr:enoyl-CoA hydratase/isomerase family protein [Chloroflexota bacterium]
MAEPLRDLRYVVYEPRGAVAVLRMNRPERLNACGAEMLAELNTCWQEVMRDPAVRVAVLTGTGRAFCAGRDIREQAEAGGRPTARPGDGRSVLGFFFVPDMDKPIVCAVNGGAWGLGWFMVCGSDIAVASSEAVFAMSEVPTGVIGPAFIPLMNQLPWLPGSELVLRGQRIRAQRAYELGLVNYVVPPDQVLPRALDLAEELATLPPAHVRATKRQLLMARPRPSAYQATVAFPQASAALFELEDTKEAAQAFAEKRRPVFRDR